MATTLRMLSAAAVPATTSERKIRLVRIGVLLRCAADGLFGRVAAPSTVLSMGPTDNDPTVLQAAEDAGTFGGPFGQVMLATGCRLPRMPRTRTSARATEKDRDLARRIGQRIREARLRAGLTQQQLAGERYTKAYVSALETGIARPSMVALSYLSERLGFPASHFIDEAHPAWTRLEVDMRLAAGDWQAAADGYGSLLADASDEATRADLLRGLAEASAR